ncbi:PREDICTED: pentatricopeptide repeat-containing protein At3g53700, chloroplastic-like [Nelumbo nucifera]|uniref:Pentatricopeptide repeat-containing protein At3g53700, chloroplastic-like n=1 Tax=Nelumbo nucifera TaxID=4432 RepID=A0A1U8AFP8_NELNU|nr:PREDICTED: pentatricopeptide repeat-containing protein At3g53700, chloroplastic-like [Nelumbo nucifera]XP_010260764.1 PREDICTED: pentatricopeptide repeat-containing protein At3g53700, chloroplastic-like [Nelumbo nucifera]
MRRICPSLLYLCRYALPEPDFLLLRSICSSAAGVRQAAQLTSEELTKINLLIPRLCESNHLPEAIRLVDAALLTNPPLNSLSLSILIDRISEEPDMTQSMALLTRLKYNPNAHPALRPINHMLLVSYFKKHKFKEAMKVFNWMSRPDSPCTPDAGVYGVVIGGFCRHWKTLEALKVLRAMVGANVVVANDLRTQIYRSLLREARITEAQQLNEALDCVQGGKEGVQNIVELLDRMIENWME